MNVGFCKQLSLARNDAEFDELTAAVCVMSCIEDAVDGVLVGRQIRTTREWIRGVSQLPLRRKLIELLRTITPVRILADAERYSAGQDMLALAQALHDAGYFEAVLEVCDSIWKRFASTFDISLVAMQKKAYAQRMLKDFENASMTYDEIVLFASEQHMDRLACEGQLGHAKIATERGNIPLAASLIGPVLTTARALGIREVIGKALGERAAIAGIRREHVESILDSFEALDYNENDVDRQRILYNVGTAFREVDHAAAAIRIADYLAAQAIEADLRTMASINRYNLAVDAGDDVGMERSRLYLASIDKSPLAIAEFYEAVARDHAKHGRMDDARFSAWSMREFAEECGMNEVYFRAENALKEIEAGRVPAIYDFRPEQLTTAAERSLAAVEGKLDALCAS